MTYSIRERPAPAHSAPIAGGAFPVASGTYSAAHFLSLLARAANLQEAQMLPAFSFSSER